MSERVLDWLLFVTLFAFTWEKIRWETAVATITISNLLSVAFVLAWVFVRSTSGDLRVPRTALTLAGFGIAFLAVYLAGYFDLRNHDALIFWVKGMVTWCAHFAFLVCGVAHVVRRGRALYGRAERAFIAGLVVNCAYGLVQLVLQVGAGVNLDRVVVGRLTAGQGGVGGINVFGQIAGEKTIYRINALTGDPNHLGVMLCVPLFLLLGSFLSERRRRSDLPLAVFCVLVQALTLSRSAALGDLVGLAVLLPAVRGRLPELRRLLLVAGGLAGCLAVAVGTSSYVRRVIEVRTQLSGSSTKTHIQFYQLVPPALDPHPLFGMGYNTFAVFYQFITGRTDFGPHSVWIAILVETGLVGFAVYLAYFAYLIANAEAVRRSPEPATRLLGYGLLAALLATAAANLFYLTMSFDYFFGVAMLTVSATAIFVTSDVRRRTAVEPATVA